VKVPVQAPFTSAPGTGRPFTSKFTLVTLPSVSLALAISTTGTPTDSALPLAGLAMLTVGALPAVTIKVCEAERLTLPKLSRARAWIS